MQSRIYGKLSLIWNLESPFSTEPKTQRLFRYFLSLITHVLQKALTLLARVHLLTNNWGAATDAADMVLSVDKKCTKAIQVKAEALFNVCQFEHALVHFYRGMVSMNIS